jgi:hypothetical protein
VNAVVNAMSYAFRSVCTDVQATAGVVDGVTLGDIAWVVVVEDLAEVGVVFVVANEEVEGSAVAVERTHGATGVWETAGPESIAQEV